MLKNALILFIVFMSLITTFVLFNRTKVEDKIISNYTPELINKNEGILLNDENIELINELNKNNSLIKSFSCDVLEAYIIQNGFKLKLKGDFNYAKDKYLQMNLNSFVSEEFLMGSNKEEFWFWSKRLNPPSLYYANHNDFHKTRLKSAFNPIMIIDSLGFKEINYQGVDIKEKGSNIILIERTVNSIGQPIGQMTFIDKELKKLVGFLVTDDKGNMIASSQITEYKDELPYKILYTWYEENQSMLIEFPSVKINTSIDLSKWIRPVMEDEIDMGKELVELKWENE